MKKSILFFLSIILSLPFYSQTNFRNLSLDEAIKVAKKENKKIFIDFYTSWCGPCRVMATKIFPLPEMGEYFNKNFVCLKMDAEKEGATLAKEYKVEAYPTFIALDTNKKVLMKKVGGDYSYEDFINNVESYINPEKSPLRMKQRYESGERSSDLIRSYITYKSQIKCKDKESYDKNQQEIKSIIKDYFKSLSNEDRLKAENSFLYEFYINSIHDEKAIFMIEHRDEFDSTIKNKIKNKISSIYEAEIFSYISSFKNFNEASYNNLKSDINKLGLNNDKKYNPLFTIIESRAKNDMNAYLNVCKKEFFKLYPKAQQSFTQKFPLTIDMKDTKIRTKACTMIRSLLKDMDIETLSQAIYSISYLEDKRN